MLFSLKEAAIVEAAALHVRHGILPLALAPDPLGRRGQGEGRRGSVEGGRGLQPRDILRRPENHQAAAGSQLVAVVVGGGHEQQVRLRSAEAAGRGPTEA